MKPTKLTVILVMCSFLYFSLANVWGEEEDREHHSIDISPELYAKYGLVERIVGPATLNSGAKVSGRITPIDEKLSHVSPRFSGVVREVRGKVGQVVQPGDALAIVQNNQNLQAFPVASAIPGVIVRRHATLGETVSENAVLFVVADLSSVWAEFAVYKQDVAKVKLGQRAFVSLADDLSPHSGEVIFFSPITEERTQSRVARVLLANPQGEFSPGAFVTGTIVFAEERLVLAVETNAVQQIGGRDTVFVFRNGEIVPERIQIGRANDQISEILSGMTAGEKYLSGKTFLLKAEFGKSEAEHED